MRSRPDLFKNGGRKYTDEELAAILADDTRHGGWPLSTKTTACSAMRSACMEGSAAAATS